MEPPRHRRAKSGLGKERERARDAEPQHVASEIREGVRDIWTPDPLDMPKWSHWSEKAHDAPRGHGDYWTDPVMVAGLDVLASDGRQV